jgi:hypothetical protein
VSAAQAAVFYRALSRGADDPVLRALAREAASDHGGSFDYFRALFERSTRSERVGLVTAWSAVRATCQSARDCDVRAAFDPLGRHWGGARTVAELSYGEFRARMVQLVERHAGLGRIERLLFRPWLERERIPPAAQSPERQPERHLPLAPQPAAA